MLDNHRLQRRLDRCCIGDIDRVSGRAEFRGGGVGAGEVEDCDRGAVGDEALGDGEPDTGGTAGDVSDRRGWW